MKRPRLGHAACLLLAGALALSGCGGGSRGGNPAAPNPTSTPTTTQPPADIAGNYSLTFSISNTCSGPFPASLRERTYEATITQSALPGVPPGQASRVLVNTVGAVSSTSGTVQGNSVLFVFIVGETLGNGIDMWTVSATQGQATVVSRPTQITGTMAGAIAYTFLRGDSTIGQAVCNATDHGFCFVRR